MARKESEAVFPSAMSTFYASIGLEVLSVAFFRRTNPLQASWSRGPSPCQRLNLHSLLQPCKQRVGEERRINVLDWSPDWIAVHGSNEFQRDHPRSRGEQCDYASRSFLPRDLHQQPYLELYFDICKPKVLRLFASLRCQSPSKIVPTPLSWAHVDVTLFCYRLLTHVFSFSVTLNWTQATRHAWEGNASFSRCNWLIEGYACRIIVS
jgi:hypothetical protein